MLEKVHLHDLLDLHAARAQKGDVSREPPLAVGRERCVYTKCYCEENVYQLCADALRSSLPLEVYAVVVSNSLKQVRLVMGTNKTNMIEGWEHVNAVLRWSRNLPPAGSQTRAVVHGIKHACCV